MNIHPNPPASERDEGGFDRLEQTVRDRHRVAVTQLSPRVRAQLAQRRHAALRGTAAVRPGWQLRPLAAAVALAGALALGLQLGPAQRPETPAPAAIASQATVPAANTILDEDPEFYAWLVSTDVQQLAME